MAPIVIFVASLAEGFFFAGLLTNSFGVQVAHALRVSGRGVPHRVFVAQNRGYSGGLMQFGTAILNGGGGATLEARLVGSEDMENWQAVSTEPAWPLIGGAILLDFPSTLTEGWPQRFLALELTFQGGMGTPEAIVNSWVLPGFGIVVANQ